MIQDQIGRPIQWTDEKVSRLWDFYSRSKTIQDIYFARVHGGSIVRKAGLPRSSPLHVLDFGCGPGYMWDHICSLRPNWRYTGLDFSKASVDALCARAHSRSGFQGAMHVTALPCQVTEASFDAVLLIEVVEHLSEPHLMGTLREAARVLRPGGTLVVSTPNSEDLSAEMQICPECNTVFHRWQHVRSWTPQSLSDAVLPHGFALTRTWTGHWLDQLWYGWLFNRVAGVFLGRRRDPHLLMTFCRV